MKKYIAIRNLILVNIILSPFNLASAAGFAVMEQSVTGLGNAFAGGSAAATDSSTVFYNPAGMSKLPGTQSAAGLHYIMPKAEFSDSGSSSRAFGTIEGTPHDNGGEEAIVTNFYLTSQVTDFIHLGLGMNATFGLATKYHDNWVGRYHAITSAMQTVNINPSISFAFNDQLSVGVGFNAQYMHLRLTGAVDYGTICVGLKGGDAAAVGACARQDGLLPQTLESDGIAKINGDGWGYGFNVGVLYEPIQGTRVGLAYRSSISHTIKGDARYDNKPAGAQNLFSAPGSPFQTTNAQGDLDLPETISFSLFHEINNQWAVMGDISWTNWSRFEELLIKYENPRQPTTVIPAKWDDVFRYALGVTYTPSSEWTFRAGTAYEETPIASADHRTPRIPDNNRYWLSVGASYSPLEQLTIDFAYTHIFMHNSEINNTDALGHTLKGTFATDADIVSAQARWVF